MLQIRMQQIRAMARFRPPGYVETVLGSGNVDGEWLYIESEAYRKLLKQYAPAKSLVEAAQCCKPANALGMAKNATKAALRAATALAKGQQITVSQDEQNRRLGICNGCNWFTGDRCRLCGCVAKFKAKLITEHCPAAKW